MSVLLSPEEGGFYRIVYNAQKHDYKDPVHIYYFSFMFYAVNP